MTETRKPPVRHPRRTGEDSLPGDPSRADLIARMIRVDHAGEVGAVRIYRGQIAVLGGTKAGAVIQRMAVAEARHLETFDKLMVERRVRPTLLSPVWHVAGYALGAATAMLGPEAAMACTVAVEEVIDEHYRHQAETLGDDETALRDTIEEFRGEEVEHRDTALAHAAREAPAYRPLTEAIKAGSRLAIWLSTRF
jgi:ubiquinone biosynthesis monooxygenase Coq7